MSGRGFGLGLLGAIVCGLGLTVALVDAQARWNVAHTDKGAADAALDYRDSLQGHLESTQADLAALTLEMTKVRAQYARLQQSADADSTDLARAQRALLACVAARP